MPAECAGAGEGDEGVARAGVGRPPVGGDAQPSVGCDREEDSEHDGRRAVHEQGHIASGTETIKKAFPNAVVIQHYPFVIGATGPDNLAAVEKQLPPASS
jgi:hypothetical protein